MKKLLAITLTLCMVFSLMVMPATAAQIEKQLTPVASGITSNDIADNAANVGSNVADGDADTMAIVDGYGRGVYVDLGAEYDLTSLEIVLPSADEITAYVSENEIALSEAVSAVNTGAQIRVGGEGYGSYLTGNSTIDNSASTRINTTGQNIGKGKTVTYSNLSAVRYIVVAPTAGSTPIAVTDIKARAMVEVGATQTVEKQITPVSAIYANNDLANETTNKATNIIDGDESTFALADRNSATYFSIDLGAEYDLTQIEVVFPDDTSIANFIAANSFSTDAASAFNSACTIWASNTESGKDGRINADGQGMSNYTSKTWTGSSSAYAGLYGETKYRYITFYSGQASSPIAISEVRVYGMVTEEITFDVDINAAKVQYGYESDGNLALDAAITAEYRNDGSNYTTYDHSYLTDNDPSTVALIGGRAVYSSSTAATPAVVILDLGAAKNLTRIKLDPIAESEKSSFVAGLNVGNISNAANVNGGVHVYVSNTLPTYDEPGEQISTSQIATAENSNYTLDGTTAYRYVAIKNLAGSYPAAFSGITIKDNTVQKEKLRFIFEADFTMDHVDSFGAYIIPFDLFNDDLESNVDAQNVENSITAGFESGSLYAVDVTDIPDEAKDVKILAIPYVSYDSEYYFGTSVAKTVNEVIAEQAQ